MSGRPARRRAARAIARALALALALGPPAARALPATETGGAAGSPARPAAGAFAFALIGDVPSFRLEETMVDRILGAFDEDLAFAIHVGDLKGGSERCDDALIAARRAQLDRSPVPLVYTPGDNDWTDCHRERAGAFDPLERLEALRSLFFAGPRALGGRGQAGGAPAAPALRRQADLSAGGPPENLRWRFGRVLFVTVNLPGSGDARQVESLHPGSRERRQRWNEEWLRDGYAIAGRDRLAAVVVIGHANPGFGSGEGRSHAAFRRTLVELSSRFAGHTLFLHGDTHRHSVERLGERLLRVESHGSPFSDRWVRIDVDPASPQPFRVSSRRIDPDPPMP